MEITRGISSFPSPFARALAKNSYDPGESWMTVTGLLSPPMRSFLLTRGKKIETGYMGTMSIFGSGVHNVLENNVDEAAGEFAERRFYKTILGKLVSGKIDFYEPGTVHDYKVTMGVTDVCKPEHRDQAQLNGYLAAENGHKVDFVAVDYFDRGWSYTQSVFNPAYPKTAFTVFTFPFDREYAENLFHTRIQEHLAAKEGNPRKCSDTEKWKKPDSWALFKPGNKKARKLCASVAEAETEKKTGEVIQHRKGESTYCKMFCGLSYICKDHQDELAQESQFQDDEP